MEKRAQPAFYVRLVIRYCPGNGEEGADDVKSAWPLCLGLHTCYNGYHKGLPSRETELIPSKISLVQIGGCNLPP